MHGKAKFGSVTLTVNGYFINNGVPCYQRSTFSDQLSIEKYLAENHPEISSWLFKNMGVYIQAFEGDILLKAMLMLLDDDVPSLPIHDALYVQQRHQKKAQEVLEMAWREVLDVRFYPVSKLDMP